MPTQTKIQCGNPFCENPVETVCEGDELCAFCQAEERTIIHNYKDESGPDEEVWGFGNRTDAKDECGTDRRVPCEICGGSGKSGPIEVCQCCLGSGYQVDTTGPNPFDEDEELDRRRQADADEASRAWDHDVHSLNDEGAV